MADERGTRLNEGLDKWLQVTDTDKLETWDGTDKMAAIKESLGINDNVAISDIVDDLNSTDVDKPLSANQGKVLQDGKEDADNTILKESDVENTLTSTSTTKPLSANQGKKLNDDKASLSGGADANFTLMPQVGGDEIVEEDSNDDGKWVRYSTGTMIQLIKGFSFTKDINTAAAGGFRNGAGGSSAFTLPLAYINDNYTYITSLTKNVALNLQQNNRSNQIADVVVWLPTSTSNVSVVSDIIAIGDWK